MSGRIRKAYAVCELCHEQIWPWEDGRCIELGCEAYAHIGCVENAYRGSNLPEELKEMAIDEVVYGGRWSVTTPEWEEDGGDHGDY